MLSMANLQCNNNYSLVILILISPRYLDADNLYILRGISLVSLSGRVERGHIPSSIFLCSYFPLQEPIF